MGKNLNNLLTSSASWSGNLPDENVLDEVFLMTKIFSLPSTKAFVTGYPEALDRISHRQFHQLQLYGMALKAGLPTNGQTLDTQALGTLTYIPANQLPFCLWHVWLKYLGVY